MSNFQALNVEDASTGDVSDSNSAGSGVISLDESRTVTYEQLKAFFSAELRREIQGTRETSAELRREIQASREISAELRCEIQALNFRLQDQSTQFQDEIQTLNFQLQENASRIQTVVSVFKDFAGATIKFV